MKYLLIILFCPLLGFSQMTLRAAHPMKGDRDMSFYTKNGDLVTKKGNTLTISQSGFQKIVVHNLDETGWAEPYGFIYDALPYLINVYPGKKKIRILYGSKVIYEQ